MPYVKNKKKDTAPPTCLSTALFLCRCSQKYNKSNLTNRHLCSYILQLAKESIIESTNLTVGTASKGSIHAIISFKFNHAILDHVNQVSF